MDQFTCEIEKKPTSTDNKLDLDIKGNESYGLDKTIVNAIRRTLLSTIETYAFRTTYENSDIIIEVNNTSLHNEFLLDRIGLIPLYLNPLDVIDNPLKYLFVLNIKHDNSNPVTIITANDFEIYELKSSVMKSADYQNGLITNIDKNNYDMSKQIPNKKKQEIFRPFQDKYYSIITEMKSTNSEENPQQLVLYGSPSVSISKEDARWQAVSCASYSYKTNEELLKNVIQEKILLKDIEDIETFKNEFIIREGPRYYHRDNQGEPYYYNFTIESQHFLPERELFIRANEIIIESLEGFKEELDKVVEEEPSLIKMIYNKGDKQNVINMLVEMQYVIDKKIWHGFDDTLGSIIQAHMSGKMINDNSVLSLCGYKRTHPLENKILFTMSMNNYEDLDVKGKTNSIIQAFKDCCQELTHIYNTIIKSI
uniref:DNA-directed RNA polymerase RpoA/D/Rpb3-type domain-containing protein n=1 Tax=viral metagenome TaxID=1070528 RepID=A0A6C0C4I0_9ZZZZ